MSQSLNDLVIPLELTDLFEDAEFISGIPADYKPSFKSKTYQHKDYISTKILRTLNGETGNDGALKIKHTCERLAQAYDQYKESSYKSMIIEMMIKVYVSLINLIKTYEDKPGPKGIYRTSSIILSQVIPDEEKYKHGISSLGTDSRFTSKKVSEIGSTVSSPITIPETRKVSPLFLGAVNPEQRSFRIHQDNDDGDD
jgi:hypothetical protein